MKLLREENVNMPIKTIVDYLNKRKFHDYIGDCDVILEMQGHNIKMTCNGKEYIIDILKVTPEYEIQDILAEKHKTEVRFCEECGKPYDKGFIAGDGDWYSCEDCFEDAMNRVCGEGKWRPTEDEGCYGGFYEQLDGDEWIDTSVYYTEWN